MAEPIYNVKEIERLRSKKILIFSGTKTETSNTKSTPIDVSQYKEATFYLEATAKSGTNPTLTVTIVDRHPHSGSTTWYTIVTFTQLTDVGSERKVLAANIGSKIAAVFTIGGTGTPSWTFNLYAIVKI
jgi:hypothetical protein